MKRRSFFVSLLAVALAPLAVIKAAAKPPLTARMLHRLDQFDIAHLTAARTACCKSIWIENI